MTHNQQESMCNDLKVLQLLGYLAPSSSKFNPKRRQKDTNFWWLFLVFLGFSPKRHQLLMTFHCVFKKKKKNSLLFSLFFASSFSCWKSCGFFSSRFSSSFHHKYMFLSSIDFSMIMVWWFESGMIEWLWCDGL